jgi:P4 family phage/plasmid primase-like protien
LEEKVEKITNQHIKEASLELPLDIQIAVKITKYFHILMVKDLETGNNIPHFYDGKKYVADKDFTEIRGYIKDEIISLINNLSENEKPIPASYYNVTDKEKKEFLKMGYMNSLTKNVTRNIADMYPIHRREDEFDSDPYEINFQNGIFDIRHGILVPHTPEKLMRNIINASYITTDIELEDSREIMPIRKENILRKIVKEALYDEFLKDTENANIVESVMEILASFLIGNNEYKLVYIMVGKPNTGKTTLIKILCEIFSDYAGLFNNGVLLESPRSSNDIRPDIIALRSKRLMAGNETNKGNKFDAGLVKTLAGNDTLSFRKPHQGQMINFTIKGKLILATNFCPNFTNLDDEAFLNRLVIIDFNNIPKNFDTALEEKALSPESRCEIISELADLAHNIAGRSINIHKRFKANKQRILVNQNSSVALFWKEHIRPFKDYDRPTMYMYKHPVKVLYAVMYLDFCHKIEVKPLSLEAFAKEFKILSDQYPMVSWNRGKSNNFYRGFDVEGGESKRYYYFLDSEMASQIINQNIAENPPHFGG